MHAVDAATILAAAASTSRPPSAATRMDLALTLSYERLSDANLGERLREVKGRRPSNRVGLHAVGQISGWYLYSHIPVDTQQCCISIE